MTESRFKAASLLKYIFFKKYFSCHHADMCWPVMGSCVAVVDFSQTVVSCRNQPVKKLTMGYITNYSYCTAMVSSSVVDIFANTCKCIELKFSCMHDSNLQQYLP